MCSFHSQQESTTERWPESFYTKTLPLLADNILKVGGKIWLPNLPCVSKYLKVHLRTVELSKRFTVCGVDDTESALQHPLVVATIVPEVMNSLQACFATTRPKVNLQAVLSFFVLEKISTRNMH